MQELDEWANAATNGFVLFALGSAVKSENFPEDARKMFVEAFKEMPDVKFLWKWDNRSMPGLSSNVKLEKWLPQQDVLGLSTCNCIFSSFSLFVTDFMAFKDTRISKGSLRTGAC